MDLLFHAIFGADGPRPPSPEAATSLEPAQPAPQMPFDAASPTAFEAELPRQMVLPRQKRQKKGPAPKPEPVEQGAANKPPDFVLKLYTMFKETPNLIMWDRGRIVIPQPSSRLQEILPNYFRHGKFTSFQRQLNNFGFHKKIGESSSNSRIYSRDDMLGYPAEALLDLRRKPGTANATWEPTVAIRFAYVPPAGAPGTSEAAGRSPPPASLQLAGWAQPESGASALSLDASSFPSAEMAALPVSRSSSGSVSEGGDCVDKEPPLQALTPWPRSRD